MKTNGFKRKDISYDRFMKTSREVEERWERGDVSRIGFTLTNSFAHNLYRQGLEEIVMPFYTDDKQRGGNRSDTVSTAFRNVLHALDHRLMEEFHRGNKEVFVDIDKSKRKVQEDLIDYVDRLLNLNEDISVTDLADALRAHLELVGFKVTKTSYSSFSVEAVQPMVVEDSTSYEYSQNKDSIKLTKKYHIK